MYSFLKNLMIKKLIFILILISNSILIAQSNNQLWEGYFSYNKIIDITQSETEVFGATENAMFSKNLTSNDLKTINSIDGLKAENISAIYHSKISKLTFIGNNNGMLLIVKQDGKILMKRGILDEVPVSATLKKINHFFEFEDKIYLSTDYGISVFKLSIMEFGDSFFIGTNGAYTKVYQTTVYNNEIYAVTQNFGIKKALLSNPFLIDYNQWSTFNSGSWNGIVTFENQIITSTTFNTLYKFVDTTPQLLASYSQPIIDLRENDGFLVVSTHSQVFVYNTSLFQSLNFQSYQIPNQNLSFTSATVIENQVYVATNENGILTFPLTNTASFEFIMPNGPIKNEIFRLKKAPSKLWVTYGKHNYTFDPDYSQIGISTYDVENSWIYTPFSNFLGANSLCDLNYNPNNENEVYICSYNNGLLKISEDSINLFTDTTAPPNSPQVQEWVPNFYQIRVSNPTFDKSGNLWFTNDLTGRALKVLKANNQWQSFDLNSVIEESLYERYSSLIIDKNNTKWMASYRANGIIAFNENLGNKSMKIKTGTEGNLPVTDVRSIALDNKNQMWIGTSRGLRIINSVDSFVNEDEIQSKPIIILEDGIGQELFFDQTITDIEVDGSNRKWISLLNAGVYLVSPNGQETIYHFTNENSPLPSDNINDIEIDGKSGEVFFATEKGLVSFKGVSTKPSDDLANVYVYPNPVRPEFSGTVKISGLTNKAIVKITDIEGNLVNEYTSEGGTIEWDTTAFGKYNVASGVYMILVSAEDGIETTVKKVMIIR